jgi:hypothetical protein
MADCKLSRGTGNCRFNATPGGVTLTVQGTTGTVVFESARYNDADIPELPSDTMTVSIVAGQKNLDVVYAFSDTENGAGVLKEVCTGNNELALVSANAVFQRYPICA